MKRKRMLAVIVDFSLIGVYQYVLSKILKFLFLMINSTIILLLCWSFVMVSSVYLFIQKDCFWGYESIGKKIMKLKIYQNGKVLKDKSILRKRAIEDLKNFMLYPIMLWANGRSVADEKYNTEVK